MATISDTDASLARLMGGVMRQVLEDWEGMIGLSISIDRLAGARWNAAEDLVHHLKGRCVAVQTCMLGNSEGTLFFLFPHRMAAELIGSMLMLPADKVEDQKTKPLAEDGLEVFNEIANLLCGSANAYLSDRNGNFKVSQAVDHLHVHASISKSDETVALFPEGELVATFQAVTLESHTHTILQVLTPDLAEGLSKLKPAQQDANLGSTDEDD